VLLHLTVGLDGVLVLRDQLQQAPLARMAEGKGGPDLARAQDRYVAAQLDRPLRLHGQTKGVLRGEALGDGTPGEFDEALALPCGEHGGGFR